MSDLGSILAVLLDGLGTTCRLLVCSLGLGFVLGLPIGVLHVFGPAPVRVLLRGFDLVMRGFPAIVLLFLLYFGIGGLPGVRLGSFVAAALALGLRGAAYQGQLVRGALGMVPPGQLDAARAVGLSLAGALRAVILPQALRFALPALGNEYSIVLKDTSLAFTVGVLEMMSRAKFLAVSSRRIALVYGAVALLYWVLTQAGLLGVRALERGTRIPGIGADAGGGA